MIVTSGASAGVYLERRVANLRLGMVLELFTAVGALAGGLVAFLLPEHVLELLFAALLVYVAVTMVRGPRPGARRAVDGPGRDRRDRRRGRRGQLVHRRALGPRLPRPPPGLRGGRAASCAGVTSALLGIGGGLVKVPVMHVLMGVPLRVATATSNLMIGITASAGAIIYLLRGGIDPYVASPTAVGVFFGASLGSRIAHRIDLRILRGLFVVILLYTSWQMLQRALA